MRIDKLSISNFRRFDKLEIEFDPKLSVIVGKNGIGKTSIVEAVAIVAGTFFSAFDTVNTKYIKKEDAHYKCYEVGNDIDVQPQYPVEISAEGCVNGKSLTWKRSLNSENGRTTVSDAKELTLVSQSYKKRLQDGDTTLILPIVSYYSSGRLWNQHREKKSDMQKKNTRTNGYIDCIDGTANIKLMLNWFEKKSINTKSENLPEYNAVLRAMKKCLSSIIENDDVEIKFNPDTREIEIIYTDESNEKMRMPLSRMSDGYRCALSMVADIAYRMAVLNPQLLGDIIENTPGIVMIDEVDLHLHPAWQQRILGDLQSIFPKVQFIVTTHAPSVINSVKSENVIILEEGQVREPAGETYGKDANTIIEGVMVADSRPKEIVEAFKNFYDALDNQNITKAESILSELENTIGYDDSEIAACSVKLRLKKMRSRNQ